MSATLSLTPNPFGYTYTTISSSYLSPHYHHSFVKHKPNPNFNPLFVSLSNHGNWNKPTPKPSLSRRTWLYGHMDRDQDRYSPDYELENGLGFFGSDEEVLTQIPTQAQSIVEGSGTVRVLEYQPYPDVDYLQELLAIQQQGPRAIGFFGTRNMGFMHQELIEILSYAMVITKNHIYTSGASGTNAAVIRGALRAEKPELLTVILPQSLSKQPPESQELLSKIAQRNNLDVDVDLALGFASHYCKIGTMECLVEEGNAIAFLGPLMRAAERGCLQVVEWFVQRGCRDMELCLALTAATSSCQVHIASYLLPHVPQQVLAALSVEILKAAGERSGGSLDGVAFLLESDFLGDPAATYAVADIIAKLEDEAVAPELKAFLKEHWSEGAYIEGLRLGQEHYTNLVRIIKGGDSPICLRDLPAPLTVAIAYLPLYRECVKAGGRLFSQRLRGQMVEAARRLGERVFDEVTYGGDLLVILERHLPHFLLPPTSHPT